MNGKEQLSAVIYCRVSDAKQTKRGDGLNSQETRCREFARHRGYTVIETFKDDITGKSSDRPAMKSMLAFLRKRRTRDTVVIIDDVSRLARSVTAHIKLRAAISSAGGVLESPSVEFGEDADSELHEYILATVSQHQRRKNAEQTKNRMRARIQNGYWVFQAPVGYKYQSVSGRGKMLKVDEPAASVVREALEGYASGRFETQAEVMRYLQDNPLFPKDKTGIVRHMRVGLLLNQPVYAGYIEAPSWGVPLRAGQHEPLITMQTYQRVQERLSGINRAANRKNLNADFPLRGFVLCSDCETPLSACWAKGSHSRYPYYLCPKRGCESYGKSIRKEKIEGEFETLLRSVQPTETLFKTARAMFEEIWNWQLSQAKEKQKALSAKLVTIERDIKQFLGRIIDTSVPTVITAYEERIGKLELDKALVKEKMATESRPASTFDDTVRTALDFLANPWNLWNSNCLERRRAVLKLTFANHLRYKRNEGFRTVDLALPFKVLTDLSGAEREMVRLNQFKRANLGIRKRQRIRFGLGDNDAQAVFSFDHAQDFKRDHGFAQGRAADAVLHRQIALRRQTVAGFIAARLDIRRNGISDATVKFLGFGHETVSIITPDDTIDPS